MFDHDLKLMVMNNDEIIKKEKESW